MTIEQLKTLILPDSCAWCRLLLDLSDEDFKTIVTWAAYYIDRHSNEFESWPMELNVFLDDYYETVRAFKKGPQEKIALTKRHTFRSLDSLLQVVDASVYRRFVSAFRAAS